MAEKTLSVSDGIRLGLGLILSQIFFAVAVASIFILVTLAGCGTAWLAAVLAAID